MGLYDLLLASNINGGSGKVIANPDEPAIAELEKLKVGDSVYSVVTKAVNDLTNYYTKSDVYTKTEVNNIAQARFQVVAELPSSDIQTNVIYLVPKSSAQTNNDYDEYIYALKSTNPDTYGWEKIGDTEIDLSGYVTTSALNTALADYTTTADLTTLLAGKQNTLTFDNTPTAQSTNPVTSGGIKSYIDEQGAKTVSGNPITITDAEAMNADHVVATITPTQTGSGTPSPTNIRPFVSASSVDVNVFGKNLLKVDGKSKTISGVTYTVENNGVIKANGTTQTQYCWIHICSNEQFNQLGLIAGQRYILSGNVKPSKGLLFIETTSSEHVYDDTGNGVEFEYNGETNWRVGYVANHPASFTNEVVVEPMIRMKNESDSSFTPYQGKVSKSIQLGQTVYSGTLDVTTGELIVDRALGTFVWGTYTYSQTRTNTTSRILGKLQNAAGSDVSSNLCDKLPEIENWDLDEPKFYIDSGNKNVVASMPNGTSDDITINICYVLSEPIKIQLTPAQIELVENKNTIITNVTNLELYYQANSTIGETVKALDKRLTRLEDIPQAPTTDGTYNLIVTVSSGTPTYSWESAS